MNKLAFFKNKYLKIVVEYLGIFYTGAVGIIFGYFLLAGQLDLEIPSDKFAVVSGFLLVVSWVAFVSLLLVFLFRRLSYYVTKNGDLTKKTIVFAILQTLLSLSVVFYFLNIFIYYTFGFYIAPINI